MAVKAEVRAEEEAKAKAAEVRRNCRSRRAVALLFPWTGRYCVRQVGALRWHRLATGKHRNEGELLQGVLRESLEPAVVRRQVGFCDARNHAARPV